MHPFPIPGQFLEKLTGIHGTPSAARSPHNPQTSPELFLSYVLRRQGSAHWIYTRGLPLPYGIRGSPFPEIQEAAGGHAGNAGGLWTDRLFLPEPPDSVQGLAGIGRAGASCFLTGKPQLGPAVPGEYPRGVEATSHGNNGSTSKVRQCSIPHQRGN